MSTVVRYNPATIQPMENKSFIGMAIAEDGEYVLYSDYQALLAKLEEQTNEAS